MTCPGDITAAISCTRLVAINATGKLGEAEGAGAALRPHFGLAPRVCQEVWAGAKPANSLCVPVASASCGV